MVALPIIELYLPDFSPNLIDATLISLVFLPLAYGLIRSAKISPKAEDERDLQFKIVFVGALPVFVALMLMYSLLQVEYERLTDLINQQKVYPLFEQLNETTNLIELHRDTDYFEHGDEANGVNIHKGEYDKIVKQVMTLNNLFSDVSVDLANSRRLEFDLLNEALDKVENHWQANPQEPLTTFTRTSELIETLNGVHSELVSELVKGKRSEAYLYIEKLEDYRNALSAERTLLSQVFNRGYFLQVERFEHIRIITRIDNLKLDFAQTTPAKYKPVMESYLNRNSYQQLNEFRDKIHVDESLNILNELNALLGYGGLIHNFKNYVIRGTANYKKEFEQQVKRLRFLTDKLQGLLPTEGKGNSQVAKILGVITAYEENINRVEKAWQSGRSIKEIDDIVRVDDSPAISALNELNELHIYDYSVAEWRQMCLVNITNLNEIIDYALNTERSNNQMQLEDLNQYFLMLLAISIILVVLSVTLGFNITAKIIKTFQHQRRLQERAEEATQAQSKFVANISHEIRTPMNGILGLVNMLRHTKLDIEQSRYIKHIEQSSNTLLSIMNDILDYSKIEANEVELDLVSIEAHSFFDSIYHLYLPQAQEKNLRFDFSIDESMPPAFTSDPVRLQQIVSNVLSNAIKFTMSGSVSLSIKQQTDLLVIEVADTGIGMSVGQQREVFKRFKQADDSTTRKFGGTGLGLSIVEQLTEMLDGEISLTSTLGEGTIFLIMIPCDWLSKYEEISEDESTTDNVTEEKNTSVLVVEDNQVNYMVVEGALKRLGFLEINHATNGEKAIKRLNDLSNSGIKPNLIIMDCHMPIMDGYEAARQIRAEGYDIPIIAYTANAHPGEKEKCLECGMNDFILKPINLDHFKEVVLKWSEISSSD